MASNLGDVMQTSEQNTDVLVIGEGIARLTTAAEYKHVAPGLIFLKYISDIGAQCRMTKRECE